MLSRIIRIGILLSVLVSSGPLLAQAKDQPPEPVPDAVGEKAVWASIKRALPFIEKHGIKWMEQRKCVTCHHSTFMMWSLNTAVEHGFPVNREKLATWNEWTRDFRNIQGQDAKEVKDEPAHKTFQRSPDVVSQLLFGRPALSKPPSDQEKKWIIEMSLHLLEGQQAEGNWKAGGQLPGQKRPLRETEEVTTMWTLFALNATRAKDEAVRTADKKGADWLKDKTAGISTEWWAVKMLWAYGREDAAVAKACREKLLQSQHKDGGWGWLLADGSDALGTGIALHALFRDGVGRDDESVRRAIEFLRKTQGDDGSWSVKGTKQSRRDHVEPTATYWGTCWAVIAMLESLPAPSKK